MKQCFGSEVLQLSTISPPARDAILAIANQSLHSFDANPAMPTHQNIQVPGENKVQNALLYSFTMVKAVLDDLSAFWLQNDAIDHIQDVFSMLITEINDSALASSVFWLMARLRMSSLRPWWKTC